MGTAGFDRPEDALAAALGRGLRRLRRRREACVAAPDGAQVVPDRGLGRARRLHRHRARQLGAALPHHLGHRAGADRALRRQGARGGQGGPRRAALPPPGQRADPVGRRGGRRGRRDPGAERGGARRALVTHGGRGVPAQGSGGGRHLGRHRRQPRPGAGVLARAPRRAARPHALRRPGPRRRPHAGNRRGGRRRHRQPRPNVALHRRHHQLRADLEPARHPHPSRSVVAVDRRHGQTPARPAVPGLRHAGHPGAPAPDRPRLVLVRPDADGSSRASSPCRARSRTRTSPARAS